MSDIIGSEDSFGGIQPPMGQPLPPGQGPGMAGYKFSPDELRVLSECNSESFFKRSLPLATAMSMGTLVAVQKGYLKSNPRFGAIPKVTLATVIGYFAGKISYQNQCAEKLMALPNSYIGQLLRDKRDERMGKKPERGPRTTQVPSMFGAGPGDIYSDAGPGNSINMDTDRPIFSDDEYHPSDSFSQTPKPSTSPSPSLSYEELRRKNRGEYATSKQDPYRVEPTPGLQLQPASPVDPPPIRRPKSPTNKYGDEVD